MTRTVRPATFALVPGAGGQGWYWHRLVEELHGRGHATVAIDLPAADDRAGLEDYVRVIVAALADRHDVVLVAQSMGGLSAPIVCTRRPVELLVLVNAMIPRPGETGFEWWDATGQPQARRELAAADGRRISDDLDPLQDFFHDVPDDVVAAALRRGEPPQSTTPFTTPFPLEHWPDVPTRVVVGRDDRFFPAAFQRRVARQVPRIEHPVVERLTESNPPRDRHGYTDVTTTCFRPSCAQASAT